MSQIWPCVRCCVQTADYPRTSSRLQHDLPSLCVPPSFFPMFSNPSISRGANPGCLHPANHACTACHPHTHPAGAAGFLRHQTGEQGPLQQERPLPAGAEAEGGGGLGARAENGGEPGVKELPHHDEYLCMKLAGGRAGGDTLGSHNIVATGRELGNALPTF